MNLDECLQRNIGGAATWEEACATLGQRVGANGPIAEDTLRWICDLGDASFAAYFDRQRQKQRDVKRAGLESEDAA